MGYKEIDEPFNTKYSTYIIGFCPDTASFFVTNQRHFYWETEQEFQSEKEGIEYFENNVNYFINVFHKIMNKMFYNDLFAKDNRLYLENTNKFYSA